MKNIYAGILLGFVLLVAPGVGWGQIVSDGLNNSSSVFTVSGGTYYSGTTASNARPATSSYVYEGLAAYGVASGTATLTSSSINTVGYTNIEIQFKLVSFSDGSSTNGAEPSDMVTVDISPDGGSTWYSTLKVTGNNNSCWDYAATGTATTGYDGDVTPAIIAAPGPNLITNGYSTVSVSNLPAISNLRVRIILENDHPNEKWVIDDFRVNGTGGCVAAAIPLALDATNVANNSFTANWNPVGGVSGYFVDVYENITTSSTIFQGFDGGTSAPTGWTFTAIGGTYASAGNFGTSSPALQMDNTGDRVVTATLPAAATQLSFWIKGQGTNSSSALLIEGCGIL